MQQLSLYHFLLHRIHPAELALLSKKLLRISRREESDGSLTFYVDPITNFGFSWLKDHSYEPEMTEAIKSMLKKGDVFVDVGANEGYFSILSSKIIGEKGLVLI